MVNVGVVGCGYWGPKHIRVGQELSGVNLTTVCDLDDGKLQQVRTQYPYLKATSNYNELLQSNVDAIVIATPVSTHHHLAKEALLHYKHVLIEKPITSTSQEALDLIQLAAERKMILMVGHTYEYHPAVDFLNKLVGSGDLGEIYGIDADRLNLGLFRPDVNVLWDLAPHDLSIMLALLKGEPVAVSARGAHHIDKNVYDVAYLEVIFSNGTLGHVHVSWLHPRKVRQITIVGSQKMAVYDDVSETEKVHIYDKGLAIACDANGNGSGSNQFSGWPPNYRYGDVVIPFISNAEPLKQEWSHFIKCITTGVNPKSDGWSGLRVTSILEAADRSLANGGRREKLELSTIPLYRTRVASVS